MNDERRRHTRIAGPYDGRRIGALDTPVHIYDVSEGGCFISSMQEPSPGQHLTLEIDMPTGRFTVRAETLYSRPGFGFAVRFVDMPPESRDQLALALTQLRERSET
jgi:hypothetical protein